LIPRLAETGNQVPLKIRAPHLSVFPADVESSGNPSLDVGTFIIDPPLFGVLRKSEPPLGGEAAAFLEEVDASGLRSAFTRLAV